MSYKDPRFKSINSRARRRESIDSSLPTCGTAKSRRIDLGIDIARRHCTPGVPMTLQEIAVWAGCTDANIRLHEQRALRKVRNYLYRRYGPEAAEHFRDILARS